MKRRADLILTGGTLVNHDGVGIRDLAISEGRIIGVGDLSDFAAAETLDCRGLHILPGVIDSQVHLREPGLEHKEDLESGGRAAVMGGVTSVFEMPNTKPLTVTAAALADKVRRASNRMYCDFAFYMGGTRDNVSELAAFEKLPGCAGIKVFMGSSTGELLVEDDEGVASILAQTNRRAAFHSEDEYRLRQRTGEQIAGNPASHPVWRDAEAARLCTERLIRIARRTGKRIHVLHVSTAEEMPLLAANKDVATVEVTPHHLTLSSDDYPRLGTLMQMNPPVRSKEHQRAIWQALAIRRGRYPRLRPRAAHARRKIKTLSRLAIGHARCANPGPRHARSCEQGPALHRALCRSHLPWPGAHFWHRSKGPHRRRLMMPISPL